MPKSPARSTHRACRLLRLSLSAWVGFAFPPAQYEAKRVAGASTSKVWAGLPRAKPGMPKKPTSSTHRACRQLRLSLSAWVGFASPQAHHEGYRGRLLDVTHKRAQSLQLVASGFLTAYIHARMPYPDSGDCVAWRAELSMTASPGPREGHCIKDMACISPLFSFRFFADGCSGAAGCAEALDRATTVHSSSMR